jgi:Tfp pilus assembly protein PilN
MNETENISFLPDDFLDTKAQRRTNFICAILAGVVMAAIGWAYILTEDVTHQAEARHTQVEREYADAAKQIQQFQQLKREEMTMAHQAELTSSLLEKIPRSNVLADVINAVPAGVWLTDFTLDSRRVKAVAAAGAPDPAKANGSAGAAAAAANAPAEPILYDVTLTVSGTASNDVQVAELIHKLGQSPLFKDVNLVISDELAPTGPAADPKVKLRKFQIEMGLASDADATMNERPVFNKNTSAELPRN